MKIAIITPWAIAADAVGGTERFTIDLASGLSRLEHQVTVFMLSGKDMVIDGVLYHSLQLLGHDKIASEYDLQRMMGSFTTEQAYDNAADKLASLADLSEFDAVQINSLLFLKAYPDKQRVFTIHTNPFEYCLDWGQEGFNMAMRILAEQSAHGSIALTAPSQHYADIFSDYAKWPVVVIPHAIDVRRLVTDVPVAALKQRYGLNPGKLTILLPSRLEPEQKRPQIVFEALANSPALAGRVQVLASGLDPQYTQHRTELQKIADQYSFEAHFRRFETMAEAYALADVVALPSLSESFGYSALEAMSLGKIVILNSIPTFKEIGHDHPNAHFFDGTPGSFAGVLADVLEGPSGVRVQLSPESWLKRYSMEVWAGRYEELLCD